MKPKLQVALDFLNLERAIKVAGEAVEGGVDWIEAGTPLIKSEGLNAVRKIREKFPKHRILADMKTMDTGRYEVESAAKAGADIVIILGVADNSTIREAVEASRNYGCEIMVDLINAPDPVKRAKEIELLGVDYICIHLGIDQQMRGLDPLKELRKVSRSVKKPLAVAGGINSELAGKALKAGASVIIVGGAITKAENAKKSAQEIKKAMKGEKVKAKLYKKYLKPERAFQRVSTANISDAMHRSGNLEGIRAMAGIEENKKLIGKIVTVKTSPGDWAKPVEAIDLAKKGEIILIDSNGVGDAVWGELASWSCRMRGIAGVVINGATRDLEEIRRMNFPVFAKEIKPRAGEPKGLGEINVPIRINSTLIRPGDYLVGDLDGVVVVPKERAVEIANRALDVMEKEIRIRKEIKTGGTLSSVLKIRKWERKGR